MALDAISILRVPPWHRDAPQRVPRVVTELAPVTHAERVVAGGMLIYAYDFRKWEPYAGAELAAHVAALDAAIAGRRALEPHELFWLPRALGLAYWNRDDVTFAFDDFAMRSVIAVFDLPALDAAIRRMDAAPADAADGFGQVDSPRIAPLMARLWSRAKPDAGKTDAQQWLLKFPRAATVGLVPAAVGPAGPARDDAETALRMLALRGHADTIREQAARFGEPARDEVSAVLEAITPPKRPPALPAYLKVAKLPAVRIGRTTLEASEVRTLLQLFAAWPPVRVTFDIQVAEENDEEAEENDDDLGFEIEDDLELSRQIQVYIPQPIPGLAAILAAANRKTLDALGLAVLAAWVAGGAPAKDRWPGFAAGALGGDAVTRELAAKAREWRKDKARSTLALDVLLAIRSAASREALAALAIHELDAVAAAANDRLELVDRR